MRIILKIILPVLAVWVLGINSAHAQLNAWLYTSTLNITENKGSSYTQYPILVYINTATLIANGQMRANGADIRFAQTCSGANLLPYYIESGINTDSTKVWIRVPQINGLNTTTIYFFTGNPAAPVASNFASVFPSSFIASSNNTLGGVQNYDWFEIPAGDTVFVFPGAPLEINASRIKIDGVISGVGAGNTGGAISADGNGPGAGTHSSITNAGGGGGSYGGVGGAGGFDLGETPGAGGATYGTTNGNDIDMGSGGGGGTVVPGANGGGAITLNGFDITVSGAISANGNNAVVTTNTGGGGGSGGGVEIIAEHIRASGTITANGGDGSIGIQANGNDGGGGGGGGRIKTSYYANAAMSGTVTVAGGTGGQGGDAAFGQNGSVGSTSLQQLYGAFGIQFNPLSSTNSARFTTAPFSVCAGAIYEYVAAAGASSYFWRVTGGNITGGQGTGTVYVQFTVPGVDTVILVTTGATGCNDSTRTPVGVSNATLTAAFTNGGSCTGLLTQFTDGSTISTGTISSYLWAFGDGGTSTDRNPTHTYATAGNYSVTLTVGNFAGCTGSTTKTVRVDNQPVSAFSSTDVCLGSPTTFTNTSTGAATYLYEYGDGQTGTSITHTYAAVGNYDVTLIATSTNGCPDSITHQVRISEKPVAGFTASTTCNGNPVQFTNTSTIVNGVYSSQWTFGDGGTSTTINPTHTYTLSGIYVVKLVVTSTNGCVDSISHLIQVASTPLASYTQSASTICLGDSVKFVATTTVGTIRYTWTFGDGTTAATPTVTHTYATAGSFAVTLAVFDSTGGCSASSSSTVTVFPHPTAAFTANTVCGGTSTQFTNTSTVSPGTFSNSWTFGDGGTSTDINPTHTYATAGTYTAKLTITTNNGCTDTISHIITVGVQPIARFGAVASAVCFGNAIQFVDSSTAGVNTAYHWYFGDGDSSAVIAPSHTYAVAGSYNVILTLVDTISGCTSSINHKVDVYAKPDAAFSGTDVCIGGANQFTNASTVSTGSITNHLWAFGDSTNSTDINPSHTYDSIGIKTVTLIVTTNNGCKDTVTGTVAVYPLPVPNFSPTTACFGQAVNFTNLTTIAFGTNTYTWNFGDGVTDTASNPSHTFPSLGTYTVTLTARSNFGCTSSISKSVTIQPNPFANFFANNSCKGDSVHLTNLSSATSGIYTSFWQFGDGNTSVSTNPSYVYSNAGTFNITLTVTSNFGCKDSTSRPVTIYPSPFANFISNDVCIGEKTVFQSTSSVTGGFISDLKWDFGDGEASVSPSPIHQYANPGNYVVKLTVTSNQGCKDSITKAVVVHDMPDPTIRALGPVAFCTGDSVTLSAGIVAGNHYLWSTRDTSQNIVVKASGLYSVTVTSQFGCKDSDAISVLAYVLPTANAGNDTTISKGFTAHLHATGGVSYIWAPSDSTINDATSQNPDVTPLTTTLYAVTVTDANGCKGSDSVIVTVNEDFLVGATNIITPNGDGKNDFWTIINIETYPQCEVFIFDRLGNRVFESKAYHNEWDGKLKGKDLPEGTYYYIVKFDGNDKLYKGAVSILR